MRYRIDIASIALREAEQYRGFIRKQSNDGIAAAKWWDGLILALELLETLPSRCPRIPEQRRFSQPLHHLLYASHRIVFTIAGQTVQVARVYHYAARPLVTLTQKPKKSL